jgi:hypothetical protein
MSALPPKADMCGALADVCFGPKADIETSEIFDLLQPSLSQAIKEFWHLIERVRNVLLTPSD